MNLRAVTSIALATGLITTSASAGGLFDFDPAPSSVYIAGFGGGSFQNDRTFTGVSDPVAGVPGPTGTAGVPLTVDVELSTGYTAGGAIGVQLPFKYWSVFHPRLELEVSYQENNVSGGSFNGGAQTFVGSQDALFVYINNYSDIKFSEDQRFVPYIGGGFGLAFVDSNVGYFPGTASAPTFAVVGDDTAFAGHIAVGATYELTENLELYSEGRFVRINSVNLDRNFVGGGADLFSGQVEDTLNGFTATGGIRFRF